MIKKGLLMVIPTNNLYSHPQPCILTLTLNIIQLELSLTQNCFSQLNRNRKLNRYIWNQHRLTILKQNNTNISSIQQQQIKLV